MKKKIKFLIFLIIIGLSFFSCVPKYGFHQNKKKYYDYINSSASPYFYAEQMVKTIPDYFKSPQYPFFRACLSLKTSNFQENLLEIQKIQDPHKKIKAYTIGANKYNALKRYDISVIFIGHAGKELKKFIIKEKKLSKQTGIICNNLLNASIKLNNSDVFESQLKEIITLSAELNFSEKELKPLLVPLKKYLLIYYKNENKISVDILRFMENISWNIQQEETKNQPISGKLHICNVISPYFYNQYRQKAICLINLAEIYNKTNQFEKIKPIYDELKHIWDYSLANPHLGKSFEVYIPKFVEILYNSGYEQEAIELTFSVPDIYPFKIPESQKKAKSNYFYKKTKLEHYNQLGRIYRFRCIKNIICSMYLKKGRQATLNWIYNNINSKRNQISLISEIFYNDYTIKEPSLASELINYQSELKNKLDINPLDFREIYIPILMYQYSQDFTQGSIFLNQLLSLIHQLENEKLKATFLIKTAATISHIDPKQSIKICRHGFDMAFNLYSQDIEERIKLIQDLIIIYHTKRDACIPIKYFNDKTLKMLDEISMYNNPDRQLSIKVDTALSIAKQLKLLERIRSEEVFLDMALEYANIIQNKSLKQSYLLNIFTEYAEAKLYKKAFDIFPLIEIKESDKDLYIKKINSLFVYTRNSSDEWIFTDINHDNFPDIFNPEASTSVLNNLIE